MKPRTSSLIKIFVSLHLKIDDKIDMSEEDNNKNLILEIRFLYAMEWTIVSGNHLSTWILALPWIPTKSKSSRLAVLPKSKNL